MEFNWSLLLTALGLAFVIEGVPYFLFAEKMPRFLELVSRQSPGTIRSMALFAMIAGAGLIWLAGH